MQSRYHLHLQDSSFIFLSAETRPEGMGRGMLRNTMYVLLYPQGPTLQAAGDELVISPWKVPFLTVHTAKNLGSWLDFSSESLDNRVLEHAREQSYHPFLPERKQVSSRRQLNTNPILATAKSHPSPRPAGYTGLPESTRTVGKTCPTAELLSFPHAPPQELERNKAILLLNCCCYTDETPE